MGRTFLAAFLLAQTVAPQCGSSGSSSSMPQNTQIVAVNMGPAGNYFNGAFTTATLCVSGTSNCQTIGGLLIDTGSSGLRVLSSALSLSLPPVNSGGNPLVECNQFLDSVTWGPVRTADVKLAGEQASAVPIQVIGDPGFPNIPSSCTSNGKPEDTLNDLGANGILGIGSFRQDCGGGCSLAGSSNPGLYYACPASSACQIATASLSAQVQNPVWLFSQDNNGSVLQFPSVPLGGQASVNGLLIFGIGTQSNNALGAARVFTQDASGNFVTDYAGKSYSSSFIDSGSNGTYFLDATTTGLPVCSDNASYYCPATNQNVSATLRGLNNATAALNLTVGNASVLLNNSRFSVFAEVAGPNAGNVDWGLPFFYGRTVFTAIEGQTTPNGMGPYWAF
jgi:hypothetical protein